MPRRDVELAAATGRPPLLALTVVTRKVSTRGVREHEDGSRAAPEAHPPTDIPGDRSPGAAAGGQLTKADAAALLAERLADAGPTPCQDPTVRERWWSLDLDEQELAIAACWPCPVLTPCRRYAVTAQERWGVWGATRPAERAREKKGQS